MKFFNRKRLSSTRKRKKKSIAVWLKIERELSRHALDTARLQSVMIKTAFDLEGKRKLRDYVI